jgi:hypothetical protein
MHSKLATSSALGAALALAITLGAAVGPAFAETPKIDVPLPGQPIHRDLGPLPEPKPETSAVTFYPDVRVNYIDKAAAGGGKVNYRFRVLNVGAASADTIGLDTRIYQRSIPTFPSTESVSTVQNGNGGTIPYLLQDGSKDVTVVCTPLPGYLCDGARLNAVVADDLDPSNNAAVGE